MKALFICLGFLSLGLGILGIFLPLLPTTPFLLLSAALFARSSAKLHKWLLGHSVFGPYISSFMADKSISIRIKVISISGIWISILYAACFVATGKLWLQLLLLSIASFVTIHILSFKTRKKEVK